MTTIHNSQREIARQKRTRAYVATSAIFGLAAFLTMALKYDLSEIWGINPKILSITAIALVMYAAAPLLMLYLRGSLTIPFIDIMLKTPYRQESEETSSYVIDNEELEGIRKQIHILRNEIVSSGRTSQALSDDDKAKMLQALKDQFAARLVQETEQHQSEVMAERLGLIPIRRSLEFSGNRLRDELAVLNRRGNLNLVIGTLTTLAAVGLLIYMVMGHDSELTTFTGLLSYYVPRVSTVVFIEIFGFFFLRLYKTGLSEMKYYQNELTTLALISVSVEMAAQESKQKGFGDLPRILADCDRNKVLRSSSNSADDTGKALERAASVIQELSKLLPDAGK